MIRLRLRCSHRHVLPIIVLYVPVVASVDLGKVMEMPRRLATLVYSGQVMVAIVTFYAILLFNFLDLSRIYLGQARSPKWQLRLLTPSLPLITYFIFFCRICELCFLEGASVTMLIGVRLFGIQMDLSSGLYLSCCVAVMTALIHMWVERNELGTKAILEEKTDLGVGKGDH